MEQKTKTFEKYFLAKFKQTVFGVVLDKTSRVSADSNYMFWLTKETLVWALHVVGYNCLGESVDPLLYSGTFFVPKKLSLPILTILKLS